MNEPKTFKVTAERRNGRIEKVKLEMDAPNALMLACILAGHAQSTHPDEGEWTTTQHRNARRNLANCGAMSDALSDAMEQASGNTGRFREALQQYGVVRFGEEPC